ncbi:MAG TPA: methyltransferase domain-containing protein [Burkholderiales bacterium]
MSDVMRKFSGSIPEYYDSIMGPAQFEPFAAELAARLPAKPAGDVLELACGTGRVTQHLRKRLAPGVRLVASDLSDAMLQYARGKVHGAVEWRTADACKLPFEDASFGAVVCAFGVMFVPDKQLAFREARRVLREGGLLLFNVWDGLENNPHARPSEQVLTGLYPDDPAMKTGSMPYRFNDRKAIGAMLDAARFGQVRMEAVRLACGTPSARDFAVGQLRGTPRGQLIEQRGGNVDAVIDQVAADLARLLGDKPFRYTAQALVVEARAV